MTDEQPIQPTHTPSEHSHDTSTQHHAQQQQQTQQQHTSDHDHGQQHPKNSPKKQSQEESARFFATNTLLTSQQYQQHQQETIEQHQVQAQQALMNATKRIINRSLPSTLHIPSDYSVFRGTSGIALVFFHIHTLNPSFSVSAHSTPPLTHTALGWAEAYIQTAVLSAEAEERKDALAGVSHSKQHRVGFVNGWAGVYAVAAAVYHATGNTTTRDTMIQKLMDLKHAVFAVSTPSDLYSGRAGYLYALKFTLKHTTTSSNTDTDTLTHTPTLKNLITLLQTTLITLGQQGTSRRFKTLKLDRNSQIKPDMIPCASPLVWSWHAERYLGVAHGIAGVVGVLLGGEEIVKTSGCENEKKNVDGNESVDQSISAGQKRSYEEMVNTSENMGSSTNNTNTDDNGKDYEHPNINTTNDDMKTLLHATCTYLLTKQLRNGNIMIRIDESDYNSRQLYEQETERVQVCHGMPGVAMVFLKAYDVFGDAVFLESAVGAGEVVWERGVLKKGVGLCHGISGNAFIFLQLYKYTQDIKYMDRASAFLNFALDFKSLGKMIQDQQQQKQHKEEKGEEDDTQTQHQEQQTDDRNGTLESQDQTIMNVSDGTDEKAQSETKSGEQEEEEEDVGLFEGLSGVAILAAFIAYGNERVWGTMPCFTDA